MIVKTRRAVHIIDEEESINEIIDQLRSRFY